MTESIKQSPNLDHFRICLKSDSIEAKKIFLQLIKGCTEIVYRSDLKIDSNYSFGCFQTFFKKTNRGTKLIDPKIFIIKDDFGETGKVSIEPIKHHEAVELYEIAKGEDYPIDDIDESEYFVSPKSHRIALNEEFDSAFENGIAQEHLKFILSKADLRQDISVKNRYILENFHAYYKAKRRFLRKNH